MNTNSLIPQKHVSDANDSLSHSSSGEIIIFPSWGR
jgi:hypothetical protein